jgi:hypothetical protein
MEPLRYCDKSATELRKLGLGEGELKLSYLNGMLLSFESSMLLAKYDSLIIIVF